MVWTLEVFDAANSFLGSVSLVTNGNVHLDEFIGITSAQPFRRARISQPNPATGEGGGAGTRNPYRFMNGASLRFYEPNGWTGTSVTCYTLNHATTPPTSPGGGSAEGY